LTPNIFNPYRYAVSGLQWIPTNATASSYSVDNSASPNPKAIHNSNTGAENGYCTSTNYFTTYPVSITSITGGSNSAQTANIGITYFGDGSGIPADEDPRNQSFFDDRSLEYGFQLRNDGDLRVIFQGSDGEGSYSYASSDSFELKLTSSNCLLYQNGSLLHTIAEVPSSYNWYVYFNTPYLYDGNGTETTGFIYANATGVS